MPPHRVYVETHLGGGAVLRHKRPAEVNIGIEKDARVIDRWRSLGTASVEIIHGDALDFLEGYPFRGDELVYCDPPYPRSTRAKARIYRHDYTNADHVRLLSVLRRVPCMVVVSSYGNDLYAEHLSDWRCVEFPGDSHTGPRTETAWLNFPEPTNLHDYRFCGADYRARERLRRRRAGLVRRIENLPAVERNALLHDLACRFGPELASTGSPG
ncbi:DNA adenine methylase [Salinarimonas soli]|nr:DNA adenine methylase [Salinarimonas soli]